MRVMQGHCGRALTMTKVAWLAFFAIQIVALLRIIAELAPGAGAGHTLAALRWRVARGSWVLRIDRITRAPREDCKHV